MNVIDNGENANESQGTVENNNKYFYPHNAQIHKFYQS
jgi:hypothetical protein